MVVPNLLVTDDDSAFRETICEALLRRGFRVTQACDGQEALDEISRKRFHMALVDVHMPRVTGLDVMRHLVQTPGSPPCVLMSAELDEEIRREAEKMRAYRILSKPVRLAQLSELVHSGLAELYGWKS